MFARPTRIALTVLLALGAPATATLGQTPAASPAAIGPAVGTQIATDAPLTDSQGTATTLARVAQGKPIMLVLFRSATWCPYCQGQLKQLGPVAAAAKAKGFGFIAISYDKPADLAAFAAKQKLSYPLYSDVGSKMIAALRLRDPRYKPDSFAYGVPYPTTLMIDGRGIVTGKVVETDYKIRPSNADLIAMLARA